MKIKYIQFLVVFSAFIMTSCGDEPIVESSANEPEENGTESVSKTKNSEIIYRRDFDCDSFIEGIDFSSLCITDEKQFEYVLRRWIDFTCQYVILNDSMEDETTITISYKDYDNFEAEKIEEDKLNAIGLLQRQAKFLYESSKLIDDLGDAAYIGTTAVGGKTKFLKILLNNVTVRVKTLNFEENCLSTDEELIKLGGLILDRIRSGSI